MRHSTAQISLKIILLLTLALMFGCANKYALTSNERQMLLQADTAAGKKRYADAEEIYQTIIDQSRKRSGASARQAILGIARIHVAYDNPDANWRIALKYFSQYEERFPSGDNLNQIRNWIRILTALHSFEEKYGTTKTSTQSLVNQMRTLEQIASDTLEIVKSELFRYKVGSDSLIFQRDSLIRETKKLQTTILKMEKIR